MFVLWNESADRTTDYCLLNFQFVTIKVVYLELLYIMVFKDLFIKLAVFFMLPKKNAHWN